MWNNAIRNFFNWYKVFGIILKSWHILCKELLCDEIFYIITLKVDEDSGCYPIPSIPWTTCNNVTLCADTSVRTDCFPSCQACWWLLGSFSALSTAIWSIDTQQAVRKRSFQVCALLDWHRLVFSNSNFVKCDIDRWSQVSHKGRAVNSWQGAQPKRICIIYPPFLA